MDAVIYSKLFIESNKQEEKKKSKCAFKFERAFEPESSFLILTLLLKFIFLTTFHGSYFGGIETRSMHVQYVQGI